MIKFNEIISCTEDDLENEIIIMSFTSDIEGSVVVTVHDLQVIEQDGEPVFDMMYDSDIELCPETDAELSEQLVKLFMSIFEESLLDLEFEHAAEILSA
jgi:hypothetical protein